MPNEDERTEDYQIWCIGYEWIYEIGAYRCFIYDYENPYPDSNLDYLVGHLEDRFASLKRDYKIFVDTGRKRIIVYA